MRFSRALLACALGGMAGASVAQTLPSVREQEIAECRPGEIATWGDGRDRPALSKPLRFVYWHAGAPAWFSATDVLNSLRLASQAWSACGVGSRVQQLGAQEDVPAGAIVVQWSEPGSMGNFGLANLSQRTLALSAAAFQLLRTRNPKHPAAQTLQMVISHEMGHFFGLMAHSRRCVDVTSYYHDGKGAQCNARDRSLLNTVAEYRSTLPTACDIQRCRAANGLPPNPP
ncbi:hypothetical protein [Paucibacter sp. Y2R2-4]|uniref:hypothetical protein n=1 Tax=Paucibacter sp. Y2R2-4 TaxID=2893553 RepID=UPI0021E4D778|nr:hypothetical protein [Paucibacter sp. Y2R2-4]MCV2350410.1 hypothetical protein [Paucibacter sp. Y2R2-4]